MDNIHHRFPAACLEVFQTISSLKNWLHNKGTGVFGKRIIILLAGTSSCMARLGPLADLFDGEQVIILLPDQEKQTLEQVQRFRPRYFGFADGPYDDVCDVINKMLRR